MKPEPTAVLRQFTLPLLLVIHVSRPAIATVGAASTEACLAPDAVVRAAAPAMVTAAGYRVGIVAAFFCGGRNSQTIHDTRNKLMSNPHFVLGYFNIAVCEGDYHFLQ